jgi:ABC-type transport system substrate-binding protein
MPICAALRPLLLLRACAVAASLSLPAAPAVLAADVPAAAPQKVLRYAFRVAETGFDPAQISDLYSRTIAANIFDAPLQLEFLARPVRARPNTAAAMPEVSADYKTFTFTLKPGIYFTDDPAFKGQKRELVAQDYVYSIKRHYDPKLKSPSLYSFENDKVLGLSELRQELIKAGKPFDYDREVEGLRALDRYRFQIKLGEGNPRFLDDMTDGSVVGAVAREVVEAYGDKIMDHPVGTGPFKLGEWRRSSRIVLDRNPGYREVYYDEEAPADNPQAQAIAAKLKGRRLPMIGIIEENQPRWLSFLSKEYDLVEEVPAEFADRVMPGGQLAPNLKRTGIQMVRYARSDVALSLFNLEDPMVGGYTPERVALRRAISLAVDLDKEIRLVRKRQAMPAQGPIGPGSWGYDPAFRSEMSEFNLARAKALLDLYGYVDKDGDGWRDQPDGSALLLDYATQSDGEKRQLAEQWQKNMDALGVRIKFRIAQWPENLKASRAGKLMMWGVGWSAGPDGAGFLELGYGPNKGQANHSRFDLPAFNAIHEKQKALPNGPERQALMTQAQALMVAYVPYKVHVHRIWTDLAQPWVVGYQRNVFLREFWKFVDIDSAELARRSQ